MVGSIQAIPIYYHMNLCSPSLTPNFDLPWPLRPLCDLLDIFFQLQNIQLNRFINGTPWYMAKTCATGFQNLGCYAAKTTFYFIEEPIVEQQRSVLSPTLNQSDDIIPLSLANKAPTFVKVLTEGT